MTDFKITFEDGSGLANDGWFGFSARGTQDGLIPPQSFYINSDGMKTVCEEIKTKGVLLDIYNMKTGWQKFADGGSDWIYNDNLTSWKERPSDDYKAGITVNVSLGDRFLTWSQSGVATMECFKDLAKTFGTSATGKLPRVKYTTGKQVKYKSGTSTYIPELSIVGWEDRPVELLESATPATITPAPAPAPAAPAPAWVSEDAEF